MIARDGPVESVDTSPGNAFRLSLADVTGTYVLPDEVVQPQIPAGALAQATASRFSLPDQFAWALHDEQGAFLEDDVSVGDQVAAGTQLWVSPKAHLG